MVSEKYDLTNVEYLKSNDLVSGTMPRPTVVESSVPLQNGNNGNGDTAESDVARKEREELIESWMSDIKDFIRRIDVSRL